MWRGLRTSALYAAGAVSVAYALWPMIRLTASAPPGAVAEAWRNPELLQAAATSVVSAAISTALSVALGVPAAFLLVRFRFPGKWLLETLLLLPLVLPPIVGGVALMDVFGPYTPIGSFAAAHHMPLTQSTAGIVLAQWYVTSPFLVFTSRAGFAEVPKELHEAFRLEGADGWTTFWRLYVPLSSGAILAGVALTFARALGEFGATMLMAYHPYSLPVYIWVQFTAGGVPSMLPIASGIAIALAVGVAIARLIGARGLYRGT
ncbi:ABC transporter permease subunit [Alicyclobacillus fructus]|uniref:ABC transporter permease subunit n=1 Tax=Alicyclobacillus fructus TaxID=2816082 RepID=UPI001A8FB464|nr:ABC transporter permease subunit [Alicyclobacillus fructus]